jgi:hypothetical protein
VVGEAGTEEAKRGSKGRLAHRMLCSALSNARPRLHYNVRSMMSILRPGAGGFLAEERLAAAIREPVGMLKCTNWDYHEPAVLCPREREEERADA